MKHQNLIMFHWDFSNFVPFLYAVEHCYFRVRTYAARDASGIKVPVQGVNNETLIHNNFSCRQESHILHCDQFSGVSAVSLSNMPCSNLIWR